MVGASTANKAKILRTTCRAEGITPEQCISIGDDDIDIAIFRIAGYCITFNPRSEELARIADVVVTRDDLSEIIRYLSPRNRNI